MTDGKSYAVYSDKELDKDESATIAGLMAQSQTPIPDPTKWLDEKLDKNVLVTSLDSVINWTRTSSLWPVICFPACCAFEFIATSASRFDNSRFGMEIIRASPRQGDLMVLAGTVTWKMAPQVRRIYDQMADPKWVIAMGACAISGGTFAQSYSVVPGYNRLLPVDVYIPGCPPRPEALLQGIETLRQKIRQESVCKDNRRKEVGRTL